MLFKELSLLDEKAFVVRKTNLKRHKVRYLYEI